MIGKVVAIGAVISLTAGLPSALAETKRAPGKNVGMPPVNAAVAEKKKGKGGKKGTQQEYMIIKMENVSVTSYKTMQGGPKGALGGGGLLDSPSGFNPGGASRSRSPAAAAAAPAGAGVGGMRR